MIQVKDVADELGCDPSTVRKAIKRLGLNVTRFGRQIAIGPSDIDLIKQAIRPGQPGNPHIGNQSAAGVAARQIKKPKQGS